MKVFDWKNPYKKLLTEDNKELYLFPDYEDELDIIHGEVFAFKSKEFNSNFELFEKTFFKFISWELEYVSYTFTLISEDAILLKNKNNNTQLKLSYTSDYDNYSETMFFKYAKECIDSKKVIYFNAINYAKEVDVKDLKSLMSDNDDYNSFVSKSAYDRLYDEVVDYYCKNISDRELEEISKKALDNKFIDQNQYDDLVAKNSQDYTDAIANYLNVCHEDDPSYSNTTSIDITPQIIGYRRGGYSSLWTFSDSYDKDYFNYMNCEFWVLYTDNSEDLDINMFEDIKQVYASSKKYESVEIDIEFPIRVYIKDERFLKILEELSITTIQMSNFRKVKNLISNRQNPSPISEIKNFEKKIQYIDSPNLYRLAMILGKKVDYDIDKKISIDQFKKLSSSDPELSLFSKTKDAVNLIQNKSAGFSIKDIINLKIIPNYGQDTLFTFMIKNKGFDEKDFLSVNILTTWSSELQRIFPTETNYVFQLNIERKYLPEIYEALNIPEENRRNIDTFKSIHPIQPPNSKYLTLGYIRYTVAPEGYEGIVLDEIQSDYDKKARFGSKAMKSWENILLKKFISYVRKNLGYTKIYMPTLELKNRSSYSGGYGANVPDFTGNKLYVDLPKNFGFKSSDNPDFQLLEKIL